MKGAGRGSTRRHAPRSRIATHGRRRVTAHRGIGLLTRHREDRVGGHLGFGCRLLNAGGCGDARVRVLRRGGRLGGEARVL